MPAKKPLGTGDLRRMNTGMILAFLRSNGASARSEIAKGTGLSRASITGLLAPLLEDGYVEEVAETLTVGRPSPKLRIARGRRVVLVGELTIDDFRVSLQDLSGQQLFANSREHAGPHGSPEDVLGVGRDLLAQALGEAASQGLDVVASGVVIPAPIDADTIKISTDFGWVDVPARALLTDGLPDLASRMELLGDILVGGWAEYRGALDREDSDNMVVYLKSDIGIGGVVFSDGKRLAGDQGLAFVAGHIPIDPNGPLCPCGQTGCFVMLAGPEATISRAGMTDVADQVGVEAALETVLARAEEGDPACVEALEETVRWIAHFLLICQTTYDPGIFVLGGYWAQIFEQVDEQFQKLLDAYGARPVPIGAKTRIRPARYGTDANRVGAADQLIAAHLAAI